MHHAGNGGTTAGLDVGGGTGDSAGGGNAAEEGRAHVTDTLCDQLHVGAVAGGHHAVSHHAGEQRLDTCQNGDGKGIGQQCAHVLEIDSGNGERGKIIGDGVEIANGIHRQIEDLHHQCAHHHGDQGGGHALLNLGIDN